MQYRPPRSLVSRHARTTRSGEAGPAHQLVCQPRRLCRDAARLHDVGLDERRAQHRHVDPGAGQFGGKGLRERQDTGLADVVGRHAGHRAERGGRPDVDDSGGPARLPQDRGEHLAAVNRAPQVDAENPLPVVHLDVADGGTARPDAGIVDHQRRRTPEPGLGHLGQLPDVVELRRRNGPRWPGHPRRRWRRPWLATTADVAAHDPAATTGEFGGERGADAAARSGDDGRRPVATLGRSRRHSPGHPADRLAAQRLSDECRYLPHCGCGLGGQLR